MVQIFWQLALIKGTFCMNYCLLASDTTKICLLFPEDDELFVTILLSSLLMK